jgi:hypothetical protein
MPSVPVSYKGVIPFGSAWRIKYKFPPPYVGGSGGAPTPIPIAVVLKGGTVGSAYSETISGAGGTGPYTFAVTSGALPTGTSLNTSTGVISGTPSAAATYSFTIQATDSLLNVGSYNFQITIANPPPSANSGWVF